MSSKDRKTADTNSVTLGPRDSLVGTLRIEGDLTVQGSVEGEIHATGDVSVEDSATVLATIDARNITIRGEVQGNVVSERRLQLSGKGTLQGDARVGRLVVEDGASFNGSITMGNASSTPTWSDTEEMTAIEPEAEVAGELAEAAYAG